MKNLKIYFTSDVHGYLYPIDYASNKPLMSGLACCTCKFQKDENTLVLDGGDMLQRFNSCMICVSKIDLRAGNKSNKIIIVWRFFKNIAPGLQCS